MAQGSHEFYIKLQVRNHRLPVRYFWDLE
jgi:expansin (peptidoglycan-binding protein)